MDPNQQNAFIQNWLQSFQSAAQQPTAQLKETQAAAGAAGASAGLSSQETVNAQLRQPVEQAAKDQLDILNKAGDYFSSHPYKKNSTFVSPEDYNNYLGQYIQKGGDASTFENKFGDSYVDPKNAFYNTPDAKLARSTLPIVKQVIDSYANLHSTGQQVKDLENIPFIGNYIKQGFFHAQTAHDTFLTGQAGNIRDLAGAGPQQGFRFNMTELNNIANLLPTSSDSKATANDKLDKMNTFLKDNLGADFNTLMQGGYSQ